MNSFIPLICQALLCFSVIRSLGSMNESVLFKPERKNKHAYEEKIKPECKTETVRYKIKVLFLIKFNK